MKKLIILALVIAALTPGLAAAQAPQQPFLPFYWVRGTVTSGEVVVPNRTVAFYKGDFNQKVTAETNANGYYELNVYELFYYYSVPITFETESYWLAAPYGLDGYGTEETITLTTTSGYTEKNLALVATTTTTTTTTLPVGPLGIVTISLPSGTVGQSYIATLEAGGGALPYQWSLTSGNLPAGLTTSEADNKLTISGMPTEKGDFPLSFIVVDSSSPAQSSTESFTITITIAPPQPLSITTTGLSAGMVGQSYVATVEADGGTLPYKWSITSGSLPAGLLTSEVDNKLVISGTPITATTETITFGITDSATPANSASSPLTIQINPLLITILDITTASLPSGMVGQSYVATVEAGGGTPPYHWSIASGSLPAGLSTSEANNKLTISGTPTAADTYSFNTGVTDSSSPAQSSTESFAITIGAAQPLSIATTGLPTGEVGKAYSAAISATGGTQPYHWSIASGSLPAGLSTSESNNQLIISGTPMAADTKILVFKVTDANQNTVLSNNLTLTINPSAGTGPALNVTAYLEGFHELGNPATVSIEVRSAASAAAAASSTALGSCSINLIAGSGTNNGTWTTAPTSGQSYYIVLKHPNHLAVMLSDPQTLTDGQTTAVDFTDNTKLFKNGTDEPLKQKGASWVIRGGDINQDGKVEILDYVELSKNWEEPNTPATDLNGDNKTEILDYNDLSGNWEVQGYVK